MNEFWRDAEVFGSLTFYAAVLVRSLVGFDWAFFWQLFAALALAQLALRAIGSAQRISSHAANGGALLVLINAFYKSWLFLLFSIVVYALSCAGHQKLRRHSWTEIAIGAGIGIASAGIALWATPLLLST